MHYTAIILRIDFKISWGYFSIIKNKNYFIVFEYLLHPRCYEYYQCALIRADCSQTKMHNKDIYFVPYFLIAIQLFMASQKR